MDDIGERLRWLRNKCGMSIEKAAELSGYSAPHIKKIEGGLSPRLDCLNSLLKVYSITRAEFFKSPEQATHPEDREAFERLQFIFNEARREDASQEDKDRADCIRGSINEFYRNAIRPVGRVTRLRRRGGGVEAAKPQIQNKIHGPHRKTAVNTGTD
jgi:transcriptional regulator with XRE-family HTH domain